MSDPHRDPPELDAEQLEAVARAFLELLAELQDENASLKDIEQMRSAVLDYDREQNEKGDTARRAEYAEKRKNAKTVPCGTYGCKQPRNEMDFMCLSCTADMNDDPDAYK